MIDSHDLRESVLRRVDETIARADRWLASTARTEEEHEPEVLLITLIEQLAEYRWRMRPEDSEAERRLRLSDLLSRLTAHEQTFNRLTLAERDGVGIYSEEQRALKVSVERTVRGLRLAILTIVAADKAASRNRRRSVERP